jgi:phage shock protein C
MRKLYKSDNDKILAGVIGGVGEYTDIDPTVLRLAYIILAIMTVVGPAVIGYIIAVLVIPKRPHHFTKEAEYTETKKDHHHENHEHKHEEKKD